MLGLSTAPQPGSKSMQFPSDDEEDDIAARAKVIQRTPLLQSRPESDSGDAQTGYLDREGNGRRKSAHVRLEEYSAAGATQQHRIVGRGRWNLTKQLHVTTDQELGSLIVSQLEGTAKDAVEGEDP